MATSIIDKNEDLITCGVCFYRYDLKDRKPKFLQCSHTVCLSCVKSILNTDSKCPFCRREFHVPEPNNLPENNYATLLLNLVGKSMKSPSKSLPTKLKSVYWCPICQSTENSLCTVLGHSSIIMTSNTAKNMEQMIQGRTKLMKLKDQGMDTLAQIVQKRRLIEEHLSSVMKSIRFFEEEVKKQQDDNDVKLAKVLSILKSQKQPVSANPSACNHQEEKDDSFTSQLMSMVEDFKRDDAVETLTSKMKKALDIYTEYLKEATSTAINYDFLEKTKITVQNTETVLPPLTLDLAKHNRTEQEVILLSHAILSLLNKNNLLPTTSRSVNRMSVVHSGINGVANNVFKSVSNGNINNNIPLNSFVLGQSIFILKICKFNALPEEIWIQPCTTFNNEFMQQLGARCYKSPKTLTSWYRTIPNVFVQLPCTKMGPSVVKQSNPFATKALEVGDVGFQVFQSPTGKSSSSDVNSEIEWNLIFPLEKFKDSNFNAHTKGCVAELFGKIIKSNPQTLTELSITVTDQRPCVIITLESA